MCVCVCVCVCVQVCRNQNQTGSVACVCDSSLEKKKKRGAAFFKLSNYPDELHVMSSWRLPPPSSTEEEEEEETLTGCKSPTSSTRGVIPPIGRGTCGSGFGRGRCQGGYMMLLDFFFFLGGCSPSKVPSTLHLPPLTPEPKDV